MNRLVSIAKSLAGPAILVAVLFAGWSFRKQLFPQQETADASDDKPAAKSTEKQTILEISEQARKNLSLTSKAARPQSYWRTVVIPGEVADRPGLSDRGVTSPAVGVVTAIHAFPGDTMRPGGRLSCRCPTSRRTNGPLPPSHWDGRRDPSQVTAYECDPSRLDRDASSTVDVSKRKEIPAPNRDRCQDFCCY